MNMQKGGKLNCSGLTLKACQIGCDLWSFRLDREVCELQSITGDLQYAASFCEAKQKAGDPYIFTDSNSTCSKYVSPLAITSLLKTLYTLTRRIINMHRAHSTPLRLLFKIETYISRMKLNSHYYLQAMAKICLSVKCRWHAHALDLEQSQWSALHLVYFKER